MCPNNKIIYLVFDIYCNENLPNDIEKFPNHLRILPKMNPLKMAKVFNGVPKRRNFAKSGHTAPDTLTIIFTTLHLSHLSQSHIGTLSHLHTLLGRYSLAQFVYVPTPTLSTQKGLAQGLQK